MRIANNRVAEELDIVTVKCSVVVESFSIYEGTLTFPVGCSSESNIPKVIDDAVDNLSLNSRKDVLVDLKLLSSEDKRFFQVNEGCGGSAVLSLNLIRLKKVTFNSTIAYVFS